MNLYTTIALIMILATQALIIDFGDDKDGSDWYITNDGVMGGLSQGKAIILEDKLVFEGTVSLENNGGFTKVDCSYQKMDLSPYSKVKIRAKGSGHVAGFRLDLNQRYYLPNYKFMLTPTGEWKEYEFQLADVKEYQMGKSTGNKLTKEQLANIIRIGFIMSNKTDGPFKWEIDYIKFD
jgi:hypothetical protein